MVADAFESSYSAAKLTVPHGSLEEYRNAAGWKRFAKIVTDTPNDINDDGEVNIADVNVLINAILNDSGKFNLALDVNEDGEINIADVNAIINVIRNERLMSQTVNEVLDSLGVDPSSIHYDNFG